MATYGITTHDYNNDQAKITIKKFILQAQTYYQSVILEILFV